MTTPAPTVCAWFALCTNAATGTEPHPILGDVPICDRCAAKVAFLKGSIRNNEVPDLVRATQGRRRSNAAGPHGTGRRPATDLAQALADEVDHEVAYEPAYGTRFRCACGEVSGYFTSLRADQDAHEAHRAGKDYSSRPAATEPDH